MNADQSGPTILLVDDTPDNLRLLSRILNDRRYQVRAVTSGARALENVRLSPPDLILLDIRMPEMHGFAVCRALKDDPTTAAIPVIFISALDAVEDKVKAFGLGGVDYITKPFQYEEVVARVETHLTLRRLQLQLQQANDKMTRELRMAGEVQASFLPAELPDLPGWQLAITMLPARETSGDFYDLFLLPDGRLAVFVADVVDKGVCAALFMALCYALFRTEAARAEADPARVFQAMNEHILNDTHSTQFVTAFYGILDSQNGYFVYSNAGHCPAILQTAPHQRQWLKHTGIPLGVLPDATWQQEQLILEPGDLLVLYTDGVIDTENTSLAPYGRDRLWQQIGCAYGRSASAICQAVLQDITQFAGDQPPLDDLILLMISRQ